MEDSRSYDDEVDTDIDTHRLRTQDTCHGWYDLNKCGEVVVTSLFQFLLTSHQMDHEAVNEEKK